MSVCAFLAATVPRWRAGLLQTRRRRDFEHPGLARSTRACRGRAPAIPPPSARARPPLGVVLGGAGTGARADGVWTRGGRVVGAGAVARADAAALPARFFPAARLEGVRGGASERTPRMRGPPALAADARGGRRRARRTRDAPGTGRTGAGRGVEDEPGGPRARHGRSSATGMARWTPAPNARDGVEAPARRHRAIAGRVRGGADASASRASEESAAARDGPDRRDDLVTNALALPRHALTLCRVGGDRPAARVAIPRRKDSPLV